MIESPYIIINRKDIKALIKLLKPLGYEAIHQRVDYKDLIVYPYVVLDAFNRFGNLAFYDAIVTSRVHEKSVYKFVRTAANIKKVAPSINTRIYLLKL